MTLLIGNLELQKSMEQGVFIGPIARSIVIPQDVKRAILYAFKQSVKRVLARNVKVT